MNAPIDRPTRGIFDQPNQIFQHRPGYVRPDRSEDLRPTPVRVPAREFKGTTFERALAAITHAQNEYLRHVETVNGNKHRYRSRDYDDQIRMFADSDAAQAVGIAVEQVRGRRDQAQADVDQIRDRLTRASDGDAAQESRNTRYWNRTKPKLDLAGSALTSVAEKLIQNASSEELGVLLQELPDYVEVQHPNLSHRDRQQRVDNIMTALNAKVTAAVPEYGRAVRQLALAGQAVTMTEHNASRLMDSIGRGDQCPIPISTPTRAGDYDPDKI